MLTIEPPSYQLRGITVFRDHQDPDQFYYLPPSPQLAQDGDRLRFTLIKYRRDITDNPTMDPTKARGAGLAQLEVEAGLSAQYLDELRSDLASRTARPEARLSPVLFRTAEAQALVLHSQDDRLMQDVLQTQPAPLSAPHHVALSLALSAEGTTLLQRAAEGGDLPVGVAYSMRFLALTPALHARVHMDYRRIYDRLAASLGLEYPKVVRAELDAELAWLVEHDAIRIEIVSFTNEDDRKRQQDLLMSLVAARVQQDFFQPTLPPSPTASGSAGALGQLLRTVTGGSGEPTASSAMFVLKAKYQVERILKEFDLAFDSQTAVELTHVSLGFLSTMFRDHPAPQVREIDLDDPFFSILDVCVTSAIDFSELTDLREAVVHVQYVANPHYRASFSFSRSGPSAYPFRVPLTNPADDEIEYQVEYFFDTQQAEAAGASVGPVTIQSPWQRTRSRVLVVSPLAHMRYRRVRLQLGPIDFQMVPRIHARVRVAPNAEEGTEPIERQLVLDQSHPSWIFRQHADLHPSGADLPPLRVRSSWEDAQGVLHDGDEESEATGDTFTVLGPFRDVLSVLVQPAADWQRVTQVAFELRYQDGSYVLDRELMFLAAGRGAAQRVQIPLLDPRKRSYRWRCVVFFADGTHNEEPWTPSDQRLLVVGQEVRTDRDVRIVLIGGTPDVLGVRVDLFVVTGDAGSATEESQLSAFLRPGADTEKVLRVPLSRERSLSYRYEVRRYTAQGEQLTRSGQGESALLVIQA